MSRSSNSNSNSNPHNSENNSSNVSRSRSPYTRPIPQQYNPMNVQPQASAQPQRFTRTAAQDQSLFSDRMTLNTFQDVSRPSTPSLVYIVTSHFTSQTTVDGVRLSESDIIGFQILAVFARIEDANSYAEHECEEIDAGVRRRRRRMRGGPVDIEEGDGITASAIVSRDGTISWTVENVGHIEVGQWVVQ